jgi:hypothetical protein
MLLKKALLDVLIRLADDFDRTGNEEAAGIVDTMIGDLSSGEQDEPPIVEIDVDEDERAEIENVLEQALLSMRGG